MDKMLCMEVVEPLQSEWASLIVLAPKKDGLLRFYVDYKKLNAVTVMEAYPIPQMDECLGSLSEARIFSTLDANCGYWKIEIDD